MTARPTPSRTAAQRLALLVLLAAFVLAQALGWIHRGLHGESGPAVRGAGTVHELSEPRSAEPGLLDALFGSHADASDCRLFDLLAQPALAPAKLPVLPLVLPAAVLLAGHAGFVARWCALFDARGPPLSR
jgi:hypothetical protein